MIHVRYTNTLTQYNLHILQDTIQLQLCFCLHFVPVLLQLNVDSYVLVKIINCVQAELNNSTIWE